MKNTGINKLFYAKIIVAGVFISSLSIPLFLLSQENTKSRLQPLEHDEAQRYFEAAMAAGMNYCAKASREFADAISLNIGNGETAERANALAAERLYKDFPESRSWCFDMAGLIFDSGKAQEKNVFSDSGWNGIANWSGNYIKAIDERLYIVSMASTYDKTGKKLGVATGIPLDIALAKFDDSHRITKVASVGAIAPSKGELSFPIATSDGGMLGSALVRPLLSRADSDIAGWETLALGALPVLLFVILLYLLYRHFESLSGHLGMLRRMLKREKPGVEIFRRDHQVIKSSMPELSEIFSMVDENLGEKARLKRAIDIITASMDMIKDKGYGQDTIDNIIEIIVNLSNTYGGAAFLFDPADERVEAVGKSNITNDVISSICLSPVGAYFVNICRRQEAKLTYIDMKSANLEKAFEGIFKGYTRIYCLPLSFKAQLTGFLILVSISGDTGDSSLDSLANLTSDMLGAILYSLAMEREKSTRLDKTRILQETSLAISSTLELPSVLQIVATRMTEYAGGTYCAILLNTDIENVMEVASFHTMRQSGINAPDMSRINLVEFPKLAEAMSARRTLILGPQDEADLTKAERGFFKIETVKLLTIIPISHSAKSIGVAILGEERIRPRSSIGSERLNFVQAIISQAASAIENARLYGYINQRVDQLTVLYNTSAAIHSEINIASMLDKVLSATREYLHYSAAAVFPVDEKKNLMLPLVSNGSEVEQATDRIMDITSVRVAQIVASAGESIIVEDMRVESDLHPTFPKTLSEISVPILMGERLIGVFSVGSIKKCAYGHNDESFLKTLAGQIAVALERARLFERERERGLRLRTIFEFSKELSKSLDIQEVLHLASSLIQKAFGYQLVAVFLADYKSRNYRIGHQSSATDKKLPNDFVVPFGQGLLGMAAEQRKAVYCADVKSEPNYVVAVGDVNSEVCIPIIVAEKVIGVLDIESMQLDDFAAEDISTLEALADIMAVAIDNSFLFGETIEKAERLALIDNINKAISATLDLDSFFRVVAKAVADNAGYRWTALVVPENETFVFKAGYAPQSVGIISTENMLGMLRRSLERVIAGVKPEFVSFSQMVNLGGPEKLQSVVDAGIRSLALFPIGDNTRAEAVMIVGSSSSEGFSPQELALLKDLAVHLRIAWQNAQLFRQLRVAYEQLQEAQDRVVQTEKLRALGEMSSGVVHDFNNVLAAILGRIQIIGRKLDSYEDWSGRQFLQKNLELMEKAATDGSQILSRISEFTKKKPSEKFIEIQIDQIIADTIELTKPKWQNHAASIGKTIDVEFRRTGQLQTTGSPSELREVFTNLINNAVDAIPGMGRIIINAWEENNKGIIITVEDTGEGMPPETRKKIFEPFFTTKGARGTGLGLSVTYGIVNRHKASIEVESEVGQGTRFKIVIPKRKPGQDETRFIEVSTTRGRTGSILVVDDEEQFRDVVTEILRSGGHRVESVSSGQQAIRRISEATFDIVITDLGMSGLSGWDLADRIHTDYPDTKIIMATGWGSNLDQETIRAHNIHSLVYKPFRIEEILQAVSEALSHTGSEALVG
jgi:signal transduction histidine kinase/putative methionine-R-sulfoxide reductase with GAF domain/CheY-like chemotaxis protein